jgi:hypothetical protein
VTYHEAPCIHTLDLDILQLEHAQSLLHNQPQLELAHASQVVDKQDDPIPSIMLERQKRTVRVFGVGDIGEHLGDEFFGGRKLAFEDSGFVVDALEVVSGIGEGQGSGTYPFRFRLRLLGGMSLGPPFRGSTKISDLNSNARLGLT